MKNDDSFIPSVSLIGDNPFAVGVAIGAVAAHKEMLFSSLLKPSPASSDSDELLTISEAAKYLSVKVSTLYASVHYERIPFVKAGSLLRFRKSELDAWLSSPPVPAPVPPVRVKRTKAGKLKNSFIDKIVESAKKEVLT